MDIEFLQRDISAAELAFVQAGFEKHQTSHGVPVGAAQRHTVVAMACQEFIGCASGLRYNDWLYLTDLFLEQTYRKQGLGRTLLSELEIIAAKEGVRQIYTWTAGYEAPGFYKRLGYRVFTELESYYTTGDSCIGLRKRVR